MRVSDNVIVALTLRSQWCECWTMPACSVRVAKCEVSCMLNKLAWCEVSRKIDLLKLTDLENVIRLVR